GQIVSRARILREVLHDLLEQEDCVATRCLRFPRPPVGRQCQAQIPPAASLEKSAFCLVCQVGRQCLKNGKGLAEGLRRLSGAAFTEANRGYPRLGKGKPVLVFGNVRTFGYQLLAKRQRLLELLFRLLESI